MKKYTQSEIDTLIKRVGQLNKEHDMFYQMVGWFRNDALARGEGARANKVRDRGRAFFSAMECIIEDQPVNTEVL